MYLYLHFPTNLRVRLISLVLAALLPALGFSLYSYFEHRAHTAAAAQQQALTLARYTADRNAQLVTSTRELLTLLARLPEVRAGTAEECNALFAGLFPGNENYSNIGVIEPNGRLSCSAVPFTGTVDLSDRAYFRTAVETRAFAVGDYQVGRVTGESTINFAYPVLSEADVRGVVYAAVDLDWLNRLAAESELPAGSTLTLLDSRGTILARYPDPDRWVGQEVEISPLLNATIAERREGVAELAGMDGVSRLYAFTPVGGQDGAARAAEGVERRDVYVTVGIPASVAYAEADEMLARNLTILGLSALLGLLAARIVAGYLVLGNLEGLVVATRRLGRGDLRARTGLRYQKGELGELARSFDEMAQALETRQAQAEQAAISTRESEKKYRSLFTHMNEGFALNEIVYDESGRPVDYVITEVNSQFEALTGVKREDAIGQRASKLYNTGTGEAPYLDVFARIAEGGDPAIFESYFPQAGRRFSIAGFSPEKGQFATVFADITKEKLAQEHAERQLSRLAALRNIDLAITSSLDPRVIFQVLLDEVTTQLRVDAADILILNPHAQTLEYVAGRGFHFGRMRRSHVRMGEGHAGRAALHRQVVSIPDLQEGSDSLQPPLVTGELAVAYYAVPLVAKGQVKGVLEVFHRQALDPDEEWLNFLEALAGQAAIAIDNATLFNELEKSNVALMLAYDTTLEGWSNALDLRDKETEGHTQRVTEMALALAQAVGIDEAELVHIRRGALLHDIGKMGIPDAILLKPGPLTEEEWEIMRRHPVYAYELLSPIAFLRPALDIPYCHHEKWDGTGYPRGLKGEQIPRAARVFAVVDVWDALRSDRPYRAAWPRDRALEHIRSQAGTHFDPAIVSAFLDMVERDQTGETGTLVEGDE